MSRDYLIGERTPKNQYALGCERVLRGGRVIKMTYPILLSNPATARGNFSKRSLYQCNPCNPWSKEKGPACAGPYLLQICGRSETAYGPTTDQTSGKAKSWWMIEFSETVTLLPTRAPKSGEAAARIHANNLQSAPLNVLLIFLLRREILLRKGRHTYNAGIGACSTPIVASHAVII